ncbi:MAG: glycosyltransferase [bacterium]|nr:glycosyltransferase [bacterium]MDT8365281.1 glycosyltransferase [bacterium]
MDPEAPENPAAVHKHAAAPARAFDVRKLAIFLPSFEMGGVERMMVNLARGFASIGHYPDFVVKNAGSPYLADLPDEVNLIELDNLHRDSVAAAALYLDHAAPHAILTSKEENDEIAVRAKERSGARTRIVMRLPVHVTSRLKFKRRGPVKTWITYTKLKKILSKADSLVAVSQGVAQDISGITGIPLEKIRVIRNPVITPELKDLATAPVDHEWLLQKNTPVLLGIGRLGRQKNFEFLVKAFNEMRSRIDCRLIILGEGRRRSSLEKLVSRLGLNEYVELPGFVVNPFAYLARSDLFVLSSLWEGSPNVLAEALALGIPVVSTDCDSGPHEILQEGRYGRLVPVNDIEKLADAMICTLSNPLEPATLKEAVTEYNIVSAARAYVNILMSDGSFG